MNEGLKLIQDNSAPHDPVTELTDNIRKLREELSTTVLRLQGLEPRYNEYKRWINTFTSAGSFEMQSRVLRLMRLFRPHQVIDYPKIRLGSANDGGYISIDDFQEIDAAFSFGIEQNAAWDVEIAARNIKVFQFDHTVEHGPVLNDKLIFEPKQISPVPGPGKETLSDLVARHKRSDKNATLILKIDIEHDEWPVFDATSAEDLDSFSQIICEFHGFLHVVHQDWYERAIRVIEKICSLFSVVHVHANNHCGINCVANVSFPEVLEVTFANKSRYRTVPANEIFPGELDTPNDPARADIFLGNFVY